MATRDSEQTPGYKFFSRIGKIRFLKNRSCLAIILVLCSGPFVCSICCAIDTSSGCCGSGPETGPMGTASIIPARALDACCNPSSESQAHRRQASGPGERLSEPIDGSRCCSGETKTDGLAVSPRCIDNRLTAPKAAGHSAVSEIVEPRFQIGRFTPVMNRGSTYLRFCVLLI
jgi:hypothetical protein